jgi:hypothetical protein
VYLPVLISAASHHGREATRARLQLRRTMLAFNIPAQQRSCCHCCKQEKNGSVHATNNKNINYDNIVRHKKYEDLKNYYSTTNRPKQIPKKDLKHYYSSTNRRKTLLQNYCTTHENTISDIYVDLKKIHMRQ